MVLLGIFLQAALVVGALGVPPSGCLHEPPSTACQPVIEAVKRASAGEQARRVSDVTKDPFYQSSKNLSAYKPGDVIWLDKPDSTLLQKYNSTIPPGLTFYRMLYLSTDLDEKPVPASAFVLLPYSRTRNGEQKPLEVIAWGHGSAGIDRNCGPSNRNDLYYDYEGPFSMALRGFAVIAPDYAGQGTDTQFNFLAGPSHASDVVYAVAAAQKALPNILSEKWVVVGHSEGGLTAWALNEHEVNQPTSGFLGAIAIAPSLANLRIIRTNIAKTNGSLGSMMLYPPYTLESISRLDPSVNVTNYFSEVGLERARLAAMGCQDTAVAAFSNLTFSEVFKDQSWLNSSFAVAWENRTGVHGEKKLAKPMLLIEGLEDRAVPNTVIEEIYHTQCDTHADAKVHLSRYPSADHDTVAFVSQVEYFNWIRELFDGNVPTTTCENRTIDFVAPHLPAGDAE